MLSRQNGTEVEASVLFFMITLLAESKTMLSTQRDISESDFKIHMPVFETKADAIMKHMASLSPSQIAEIMDISVSLASKAHSLGYDFPHKLSGYKAIDAFIGDAYRGLQISTVSDYCKKDLDSKLRIVSSVYGILKPSDIIKPYRCEFNKDICPGQTSPAKIFKPKVTIEFVKYIKENKVTDVINLLPGDADKCLDWKIIRAFASVHKVVFQTITPEGKLKTPIAKRLKELRGIMTRTILEKNIQSFQELTQVESPHFIYSHHDSKPLLPVFITTE